MTQIIQRHRLHVDNLDKVERPLVQVQADEDSICATLTKELEKKTRELSCIHGKGLEELSLEELIRLERQIERGQSRLRRAKGERLRKEIVALKGKELQYMKENEKLKEKKNGMSTERVSLLRFIQTASSESEIHVPSSAMTPLPLSPPQYDTSLRLGLPVHTGS
ncbi:hypothetical protein Cgig2_014761 [Carnegiea gigantea]|uniref:K-box domain-containing protein n=1 Tax=Carnegiea gigantea TaxID=171969 RepID=A0A9Q1QRS1_9CARY|nr:hypothetical protein Cgig2_014761 [Carnegiea gigantea]